MSADGNVCACVCICVYVCVRVCVNSMSFTPNIVNIHRTILHVLALHLGWGERFWFTSLEHHKKGEEGEERAREKERWEAVEKEESSNSFSRL